MFADGPCHDHQYDFADGGEFVDHAAAGTAGVDICGPCLIACISDDVHSS